MFFLMRQGCRLAKKKGQKAPKRYVLGRQRFDSLRLYAPARNGSLTNGYTENGTIYINAASKYRPVVWIVAHELTHSVENSGAYNGLLRIAKAHYGDGWADVLQSRIRSAEQAAQNLGNEKLRLTAEAAERELAADFFADKLLTDEDAIRRAVNYDPTTAQRIAAYLKNLLSRLQGREPTLEWALDRYGKALKEAGKSEARQDTAYSFGGENAVGYDTEAEARAERLEREGADRDTVWREAGRVRGSDDRWRFEIDDSGMEYSSRGDMAYMNDPEYREYRELWDRIIERGEGGEAEFERLRELDKRYGSIVSEARERLRTGNAKLGDVIRHDELFRYYPQL